jgi:hypothetical protein
LKKQTEARRIEEGQYYYVELFYSYFFCILVPHIQPKKYNNLRSNYKSLCIDSHALVSVDGLKNNEMKQMGLLEYYVVSETVNFEGTFMCRKRSEKRFKTP